MKQDVASRIPTFRLRDVERFLKEGGGNDTVDQRDGGAEHVNKMEKFRKSDMGESNVERVVVDLNKSDTEEEAENDDEAGVDDDYDDYYVY